MKIKYYTRITFEAPYHLYPTPFFLDIVVESEETTFGEVKRLSYDKASTMEVPEGYVKIEKFEIIKEEKIYDESSSGY